MVTKITFWINDLHVQLAVVILMDLIANIQECDKLQNHFWPGLLDKSSYHILFS